MEGSSARTDAPHIEVLLGHTAWARRLAAGIVTEAASAEDAVQNAWVAALLHPPRHARNLRSWLAFLVRNAVRQEARGESRRRQREREVARPERLPAAGDAIERAELHRRLVEAVLALPESCRSVVVLAYFDDLAPREIARRLGMPSSTVRSHIRRGLQRLREDLEGQSAGDDRDLLSSLAALAWNSHGRPTPVSASTVAGGGILMAMKTKLVLAAAVVALLGGWIWKNLERDSPRSPVEEFSGTPFVLGEESGISPHQDPAAPRETVPDSARASTQAPERQGGGALLVTVAWESDGRRAAGVGVQVRRPGDPQGLQTIEGETDEAGVLRLDELSSGHAWVAADRTEDAEVEIRPSETAEVALMIPPGVDVRGRVVDIERRPVPGAAVWLSWRGEGAGRIAARADGTGAFSLRDVQEHQRVGARATGRAPSSLRVIDRFSGTMELTLVLPGVGGAVEGQVFSANGAPIAEARIEVSARAPHLLRYEDTSFGPAPPGSARAMTSVSGEFRIEDAAAGASELVVRAKGFAWSRTPIEVPEGGTAHAEVSLGRGAILSGTVRDARQVAQPDVPVWLVPSADPARLTLGRPQKQYIGSTDANGQFRIEGLPPEPAEVVAERDDLGRASASLHLAEGIETTWDAVLSRGLEVSGRLVDQNGRGIAGWFVAAKFGRTSKIRDDELEWLGWRATCRSDGEGRFAIPNCPPNIPLRVAASAPDSPGQELGWLDDVKAGAEGLQIQVGEEARPSAFLLGEVLDASDRPLSDAEISAHRKMGGTAFQNTRTDSVTGAFRLGPLPPGIYRVEIRAGGQSKFTTSPYALKEGQELDLGSLRLAESGTVLVRLRSKEGSPPGDVNLSVYGESHTPVEILTVAASVARSSRLPVGHYRLVVREDGQGTQQVPFDVSADHETELAVDLSVVPR
jgi:RNA polymerase sigma-70 factor (ECF subfamily)